MYHHTTPWGYIEAKQRADEAESELKAHERDNQNRQNIEMFLKAENERNWDQWIGFYHPNAEYIIVSSKEVHKGKEEILKKTHEIYKELPDWQFNAVHVLSGENTVMVEFEGEGHFTGTHEGKQYKDVPLKLQAVCVFEFREGLICREREYWDPEGFKRQLEKSN